MLYLAPQGFRVIAKNSAPEIRTSQKGTQYMRLKVVPYLTKEQAPDNEMTLWISTTVFADTLPVLDHGDYVYASGRITFKKADSFDTDGKFYPELVTNDLKLVTKEELQSLMGYGKNSSSNSKENCTTGNCPTPPTAQADEDDIPF